MVLNASFPETRGRGKSLIRGLFDGEHYLPRGVTCREFDAIIHGEHFSGILIDPMDGALEKTKPGFESMNRALKKKAEQ
jgi:hypothetical protein